MPQTPNFELVYAAKMLIESKAVRARHRKQKEIQNRGGHKPPPKPRADGKRGPGRPRKQPE